APCGEAAQRWLAGLLQPASERRDRGNLARGARRVFRRRASEGVQHRRRLVTGRRGPDLACLELLLDVCARSRSRDRSRPPRPARQGRRVPDLFRIAGVVRGFHRFADDGTQVSHRVFVRRAVRRHVPRWHRLVDHPDLASHRGRTRDVQVRRSQLLPHLPQPDPAPRARRVLHPRRRAANTRPSPSLSVLPALRLHPEAPEARALHSNEVGLLAYGILGVVASAALLVTGALYWKELFGGFVIALWNGGLVTRILLILLGLFVGGPLIRGVISLVRFVVRKVRAISRMLRFRFEQSWRVEAAELIDALPIFGDVPEDTLSDLAGRVKLVSVGPGQNIVRQGERADAFY